MYGPLFLRRQVTFPAFSYVTAILIVTNATLGDTVRGCWLALYATLQTVCPAMAVFWFIGPTKFSYETIALTVALASIVVVLPSSSHVLAKRIALGQIVIIYVVGFIGGVQTHPLMHPVHVASTTAMGVAASFLATLLPFPRLASLEVSFFSSFFWFKRELNLQNFPSSIYFREMHGSIPSPQLHIIVTLQKKRN